LTAAKFEPLVFSMPGLALSYAAKMFVHMILYDFCMFLAEFSYIIVYIGKVESRVQIADQCEPWKISNGAEKFILQALQF
jgi:hypothetical protein